MNSIRVDVYSHHVRVTGHNQRGLMALKDFCRSMAQYGMIRTQYGSIQRVMLRVFGAATANRMEYRFHRHLLDDLTRHLEVVGGYLKKDIEVIHHPVHEGIDIDVIMNPDMIARDYQEPIIDFMTLTDGENEGKFPKHRRVVTLQTGKGKDQSIYSWIKIPGGWKQMGTIQVGDTVTAWDGTPTKVTGVFPQGEKQLYRVTFKDGRSTLAGAEHLWKVCYINTTPRRMWRVVDTMEVMRYLEQKRSRVYIPLCKAEDGEEKEFLIAPYVLGVILGDGCTSGTTIELSKPYPQLFEEIAKELPSNLRLTRGVKEHTFRITRALDIGGSNPYIDALRGMDLMGKRSWEKFIPTEYLHGSKSQRLALLQGLMDTDGTVNKPDCGGAISFCSTSLRLAQGVQYLVRSLGGIASISRRNAKFTYSGESKQGRVAYQVNIRYKVPSELFRLSRKRDRTNDNGQYASKLDKLEIVSIVPEGIEETQCISIEHPDRLYVTDDFIVTHNTFCALKAISLLRKRTIIIIKGMYVKKWIADVEGAFSKHKKAQWKKGDLVVVRGSQNLIDLIELAKAGELTAKIIIITNTTMQNYIQDYEGTNGASEMYGCKPEELYEVLDAGVRLIDEAHQDFHLNYKMDMYTNIKLTLELTATIKPDDRFLDKMYHIMFPTETRYRGGVYDKYIAATAIMYGMRDARKIRHKRRGQYSHVVFEQQIMRNKQRLAGYFGLIDKIMDAYYIQKRVEGQKLLIFGATVEFCQMLTAYLKEKHKGLSFCCYVSGTDYEDLLKSDCTVSTLKSAGTAVDIPGLRTVIMTDSLMSGQANDQALGRLRKLAKWPEVTPEFVYLVCADIPKHVSYHRKKMEHFEGKVISHKEVQSMVVI